MSYFVLIDTSHRTAQVALIQDGKIIAHKQWPNGPLTGREVLVAIDDLLRENQLTLNDITRIGVHTGPGGYSSLRAGIVTTLMLRVVNDIEIVSVTGETLEGMAAQALTGKPTEYMQPRYPQ